MKLLKTITIASLALVLLTFGGAMAAMDHSGGHDKSMDHSTHSQDMGDMDHSSHKGKNIRNTTVDGYRLAYHLIDMQERIKAMKAAGHQHEMNMTHHLMIYVNDPSGTPVVSARVGYLVETPDGSRQKLMCMGMGGGYGADVNLAAPGTYTIKSKMVVGDKKIMDNFSYMVH